MYDTHCHLTFDQYTGFLDAVVARAREVGVRGLITVSTTSDNAVESLRIAESYPDVWCTSGVHPLHADEACDWTQIRTVGEHERCVAWGEMGLDNHYDHPPRHVQDRVLEAQLEMLANAKTDGLEMPIVLHCRDAFDDLLAIIRAAPFDPSRYVFHCFTGGPDEARAVLDFGAWISFTGVVTFKNARHVAEAAKLVPEDRIMVETDAPFLTPEPHRKVRPNEPCYVVHTAETLAELRGVGIDEMEATLDANAERFFGIGG